MGRSRDIADMLGKTELANTGNEALITTFDAVDSAYVSANSTPALVFYSTLDSLPVSGLSVGQQAYVSANSRLYISDGSGWYNKALITLSPTMTLSPSGTITLANDGVTTSTVTIVAVDSDTPGSGLTYSVESDGNMLGRAVISQDSSVFTIRPLSSDSGATDGTFTLTFKTSDGVNLAFDSADFSLTFSTIVDSSAPTVLLMKAAGNSATNAAITYQNSSDVSTGFTETGNPQASTFSPYRSGGYSIYFDGSGDYMNPKTAFDGISPHWTSATDEWTIEFWIYRTGFWTSGYPIPIGLSRSSDGYNTFLWGNAASASNDALWLNNSIYNLSDIISDRTWTHVALVYNGTNITVYYDGVSVGSTSFTPNAALSALEFGIGAEFDAANGGSVGNYFGGYMTDIRLSYNARYTTTFTPPTDSLADDAYTVFLLRKENGYLKDVSSGVDLNIAGNTHTVPFSPIDYSPWTADDVGGSVYFDQSNSDGLSTTTTAVGTGEFNYEAWIYLHTTSAETIVDTRVDGTSTGIEFRVHNGVLRLIVAGTTVCTGTTTLLTNIWYHVAARRNSSGVCRVYLNGERDGSSATKTDNLTNTSIAIGNQYANSQYFDGYIADFRYRTESEYTTSYTPPTSPFSNTASTQLLMNNKSDANIYDAAAANAFLLDGNTTTNNSTRKFTTSSAVYFDGTGDAIEVPETGFPAIGTSDFTIEAWVYANSLASNMAVIDCRPSGTSSGVYITLQWHTTNGLGLYVNGWQITNSSSALTVTTWHHVALCRSGSSTRIFVDGTQVGSTYSDSNNYLYGRNYIGGLYNNTNTWWNGYMQDFRVSIGKARYTANFTPPTAEFEL